MPTTLVIIYVSFYSHNNNNKIILHEDIAANERGIRPVNATGTKSLSHIS